MRHFWKGFEVSKTAAPVRFKKHVIVLYWSPGDPEGERTKDSVRKLSLKYPSVAIKTVNVSKDPSKPLGHHVHSLPTVLLLKDGREVERVLGSDGITLLEKLFKKATT